MKVDLESFNTGWYGLTLGIKSDEIDSMIEALQKLKSSKEHFHLRSDFEGEAGVGDIEIYFLSDDVSDNLKLDPSPPIYPNKN